MAKWALAFVVCGCSSPAHRALIGVWKSDAQRTLLSMRATPDIPQPVRAALEDGYYGHLIVEYRIDTVRAHFDDQPYDSGYQPYEVIEIADDRIVTREWNELLGEFGDSTTFFDGACIFGIAAQYAYREYFCPVDN